MEYNNYVLPGLNPLMMKYLGDQLTWYGSRQYPPIEELESFISDLLHLQRSTDLAKCNYSIHIAISDTYYIMGNIEKALEWLPKPDARSRTTYLSSWRCDLKYALGMDIDAYDLLTMNSKRLTNFATRNLRAIQSNMNIEIARRRNELRKRILDFVIESDHLQKKWFHTVYGASFWSKSSFLQDSYKLENSKTLTQIAMEIMRWAENQLREDNGIPKVAEGWLAETELYHLLKEAFPALEVVHQAKPKWLGKQHLDIYFPDLATAIEYQGLQHDAPVEYFGGTSAYGEVKKRDKRKKALCTRNRIKLLYVRPGYDIAEVIKAITAEKNKASQSI